MGARFNQEMAIGGEPVHPGISILDQKGDPYENNPSHRSSEIDRHAPTV